MCRFGLSIRSSLKRLLRNSGLLLESKCEACEETDGEARIRERKQLVNIGQKCVVESATTQVVGALPAGTIEFPVLQKIGFYFL